MATQLRPAPPATDSPNTTPAPESGHPPAHPLRFALLGAAIGIGNRGVSALGASTIRLVSECHPGAQVSLLIGDRNAGTRRITLFGVPTEIPVVNYRWSPKAPLHLQVWWILLLSIVHRLIPLRAVRSAVVRGNPWIRAVTEADVVADIRGGDSFSDIYGVKRFVLGSLPALAVIILRGSIDFLPQTYGPFQHARSRALARYILRRARRIFARDAEGPVAVRALVGDHPPVTVCADVAFCLEPIRPATPDIQPPLPSTRPATLIGINVNGLMFNGGYTRANMFGLKLDYPDFLRRLTAALLKDPATHLLFVPHTFAPPESVESDPEASRRVIREIPESLRSRVHLVSHDYDQHGIKGVIGLCDFFIGSRMHACIAALSQGIPCVGMAYSKKFLGVFESVGMREGILDGREVDAAGAVEGVLTRLKARAASQETLRSRVPAAQDHLRETFREMLATGARRLRERVSRSN